MTVGWTLRLKSTLSAFEANHLADGGYGLVIMPYGTYSYFVAQNGIETDSANEEAEAKSEDEESCEILMDPSLYKSIPSLNCFAHHDRYLRIR